MQLRKLEIYGFKSFADKTELEFGSGVTAIVGPNGSGKSNISDAIRWGLGEQSIRTLRGAKAEDVIFAGSLKRRALGVAEVSLVFDNSDNVLPIDFNEVTITRRVFRSGDSEYYINKSLCRLKDVHDLLADTGIGRDSMTVISQNKIDEVLNNKPEDRRLFFEEAAGITKYKQRKRDALRKLQETEQNLTRLQDLMLEIETQLEPLAESAARTTRYNELFAEQRAYQITLLNEKLARAAKMAESAELEQANLTDQDIVLSTRLSKAEAEKERLMSRLTDIDANLSAISRSLQDNKTEVERLEGRKAVLSERISQGEKAKARIRLDMDRLQQQDKDIATRAAALAKKLADNTYEQQQLNSMLAEHNQIYLQITQEITRTEQQLEQSNRAILDRLQQLAQLKNTLSTLEHEREQNSIKSANADKDHTAQRGLLKKTEEAICSLGAERQAIQNALSLLQNSITSLTAQKVSQEQALLALNNDEHKCIRKLNELESRHKVLVSMQNEYEGFGRGIKNLLKSNTSWRSGIYGAVAEIIHVPEKFVTAIEVALGGALQYLIVQDDEVAKKAIAFLKQQNLGRATFLPLNTVKGRGLRDEEKEAARAKGAYGCASALVSCEARFAGIIEYLLGRIIVAENIDAALAIARKTAFSVRVVTLEGEVVNPGGSLTGGSTGRKEASYLSRSNEIQVITGKLAEIRTEAAAYREEKQRLQADLAYIDKALTAARTELQQAEVRYAETSVYLDKVIDDKARLEAEIEALEQVLKACSEQEVLLKTHSLEVQRKLQELENLDVEHKNDVVWCQNKLKKLQHTKDITNEQLTDIKVKLSSLTQDFIALQAEEKRYQEQMESIRQQLQQLASEEQQIAEQIAASINETAELNALRLQLGEQQMAYELEQQQATNTKFEVLSNLSQLEKELKEVRRKQQELQTRLNDMTLMAAKYKYEVTHCEQQLMEQFAVTVEQARSMSRPGKPEEITGIIKRLEREIMLLGPINPAAIEEYARVQERYQFLATQLADLTAAKEYLSSVLQDIDNTMAKQFKTAFTAINEYFSDIFIKLFGGGQAKLQLLEPDNLLESGIEIIVQPPGKKQQNLTLLSGGERALTVIALLFAMLTYRPSPFCVVDEIDAALDEANVQRFAALLNDYAKSTQFIVVTHRKGTMERADVMHGITMEESGVSRVVSVKFMDKAG